MDRSITREPEGWKPALQRASKSLPATEIPLGNTHCLGPGPGGRWRQGSQCLCVSLRGGRVQRPLGQPRKPGSSPTRAPGKKERETGPQVEEGQGSAVRALQFHEKTRLSLFGVPRANATDLPVFRNGRDVTPGASCSPPNLHRPRKGVNSRLRNVLTSVMDRDRAQLPAGSQGTFPQPGSGTASLGLSPSLLPTHWNESEP